MSVSLVILIITCLISIIAFQPGNNLFHNLEFSPYRIQHTREFHRFFTHAFLHADWLHLIINMYVLYIFGTGVEEIFVEIKGEIGHVIFLSFYLLAVIISCIPSYQKNKNNHLYVSVGASGGTSAIVFSYILFNPLAGFYLMFIPIEIPAILFGIAYLAYSYYMSYQAKDNIAHDVHFFGALFGIIFTLLLNEGIFSYFLLQLQQW